MMRNIFKTNFSELQRASRIIIIKGGVNKRWESFYDSFVFKEKEVELKTREE
jgi:hypothetical protein